MTNKKANGEGSITKISNGTWQNQITIGFNPVTGKPIRKSFSGKTKMEAIDRGNAYKASILNGTHIEPNNITVGGWLAIWLKTYKKDSVAPTTFDWYENIVTTHIITSIGEIKLQKLKTEDIQVMYNNKFREGKKYREGGLSRRTIESIHIALKQALDKAVKLNYISKNAAEFCDLPKKSKSKVTCISAEDQIKIIKAIDVTDRYGLAILFDFGTGIRQGELIALTWDDIDFEEETVNINKSHATIKDRDEDSLKKYTEITKATKTNSSIRKLSVPHDLITLLRRHKKNMIEENLAAGRDNKENNLVFPSTNGTYLNKSNIRRYLQKLFEVAGVEYSSFHSIRHSFASRLLEINEHPSNVQKMLGHSTITTTLDTYSHTNPDLLKNAASKVNDLLNINQPDQIKERQELYVK